jgi:hypothetical protein
MARELVVPWSMASRYRDIKTSCCFQEILTGRGSSGVTRRGNKKRAGKTGPQMTNETRKVRKNYNLKSHPLRFEVLPRAAEGSVVVV